MIIIKNLHKNYGTQTVLNNLSLELEEEHIHGLIGENGAGKTTLFECLRNLQKFEGEIIIPPNLKIAYLPATLFFYSNLKGSEYLEFCLSARKEPVDKNKINRLNELFELPLSKYASTYSDGMKRKLALLALFIQQNDLYLLDEPFNGLDLSASILLKQLLSELEQQRKTVLISSHIISSLTDVCRKIHYLKNGIIMKSYIDCSADEIENDLIQNYFKK